MPCGTVVLCGITSRFQLLSPCTGQVTHALLTRPPLGIRIHPKTSSHSSFDLHVLSTPPAFILSQDRTLKLIVLSRSKFADFSVHFLPVITWFDSFEIFFFIKEISGLCVLSDLRFSRFCLLFPSGATLTLYQMAKSLSTTFLNYFQSLIQRRKRDLNPRAGITRPTPLAGGPLRPLEYFSGPHSKVQNRLYRIQVCFVNPIFPLF